MCVVFFFFQAEDGIRDLVRSRGLGDVYKRQDDELRMRRFIRMNMELEGYQVIEAENGLHALDQICLLYTSDAADERSSVDLGGRRIIKKKKKRNTSCRLTQRINTYRHSLILTAHRSKIEKKNNN